MRRLLEGAGLAVVAGLIAFPAMGDKEMRSQIAQSSQTPLPQELYRSDQPRVIQPDVIQVDATPIIDRFAAAYATRNRPRLAIFYNREFSDRLSQWFGVSRVAVTESRDDRLSGEVEKTAGKVDLKGRSSGTVAVGRQDRLTDPRRRGLEGVVGWRFETAFSKPFLEAGARLIDRAAVMRLTAADSTGAHGSQRIETKALTGYADILVEILFEEFTSEDTGVRQSIFRVTAKNVNTGELVTQILAEPKDNETKRKYVGSSYGFIAADEAPPRKNGYDVAIEMIQAMNKAWSR